MVSLPIFQNRTEGPPDCFGSDLWDPKASECSGGPDPTYTNKWTGTHVRNRCSHFDACGAKVQSLRAQTKLQNQPFNRNWFQPQTQQPPMVSAAASRVQVPASIAPMSQMMRPMQPPQPFYSQHSPPPPYHAPQQFSHQPMAVPQMHPSAWHPAPAYQFNHGIPHYLTSPEPQMKDESIWATLFRAIVRSIFKSSGHTVAYFFDTTTMRTPPNE